jgi:serine phosphatase RsbU (regulator of sigma subunit)
VDRCGPLLDALAEAVTIRSEDGRLEYANHAALVLFGCDSVEQLRSRTRSSHLGSYVLQDEHGQEVSIDRPLPPAEEVLAEPASPAIVQAVDRVSGELRWLRFRSTPLRDTDGELIASVTVIEDLTPLKSAEVRTQLLAETGRMLVSSLDYEETLRNVAHVAIPELADWCSVDLLDDDGRPQRVATAPAESELGEFRAPEVDPDHGLRHVIRTGSSIIYRRVTRDQLARWASSAAQLRALQSLSVRSVLIVPMRVPDRTIGAMTFVTASSGRHLGPEDQALAEQLGRRAAVAVENARLHSRLQVVAETLERSLLPGELPRVPGWRIASLYRPARSESRIDVGGDFFEVFQADGRSYALIGDVEGKGVVAATLTALMRNGAHFAAGTEAEPAAILERLDEGLRRHGREATCTAMCVRLEHERLVLASAGHPPALLVSPNGEVRELAPPGPLLGAFADASFRQEQVPVSPGDVLLTYTDGVIQALGSGRVARDRLRALLADEAGRPPQVVLRRLESGLREHQHDARLDDVAALAISRR